MRFLLSYNYRSSRGRTIFQLRWCAFLLCVRALAQTAPEPVKELDAAASQAWIDTAVDLRTGDSILITAMGTLNLGLGKSAGPQGAPRGFRDLLKTYPVNEAGLGAAIGRIGSSVRQGYCRSHARVGSSSGRK